MANPTDEAEDLQEELERSQKELERYMNINGRALTKLERQMNSLLQANESTLNEQQRAQREYLMSNAELQRSQIDKLNRLQEKMRNARNKNELRDLQNQFKQARKNILKLYNIQTEEDKKKYREQRKMDQHITRIQDGFKKFWEENTKSLKKFSSEFGESAEKWAQALSSLSIANALDDSTKSLGDIKKELIKAGLSAEELEKIRDEAQKMVEDSNYTISLSDATEKIAKTMLDSNMKTIEEYKKLNKSGTMTDLTRLDIELDPEIVKTMYKKFGDQSDKYLRSLGDSAAAIAGSTELNSDSINKTLNRIGNDYDELLQASKRFEFNMEKAQDSYLAGMTGLENAGLSKEYQEVVGQVIKDALKDPNSQLAQMYGISEAVKTGNLDEAVKQIVTRTNEFSKSNPASLAAVQEATGVDLTTQHIDDEELRRAIESIDESNKALQNKDGKLHEAAKEREESMGLIGGFITKAKNWLFNTGPARSIQDTLADWNVSLSNAANLAIITSSFFKAGGKILGWIPKIGGFLMGLPSRLATAFEGLPILNKLVNPLLNMSTKIENFVAFLKSGNVFSTLITKITGLFSGLSGSSGILSALGNVAKLLAKPVALLGPVLDFFSSMMDDNNKSFSDIVFGFVTRFFGGDKEGGIWNAITNALKGAGVGFMLGGPVGALIGALVTGIGGYFGSDKIAEIFAPVKDAFNYIGDLLLKIPGIKYFTEGFMNIVKIFRSDAPWYKKLGQVLLEMPKTILNMMIGPFVDFGKYVAEKFKDFSIVDIAKNLGELVTNGIASIFNGLIDFYNNEIADSKAGKLIGLNRLEKFEVKTGTPFLNGTDYVPAKADYTLHPGERVLTKKDNKSFTEVLNKAPGTQSDIMAGIRSSVDLSSSNAVNTAKTSEFNNPALKDLNTKSNPNIGQLLSDNSTTQSDVMAGINSQMSNNPTTNGSVEVKTPNSNTGDPNNPLGKAIGSAIGGIKTTKSSSISIGSIVKKLLGIQANSPNKIPRDPIYTTIPGGGFGGGLKKPSNGGLIPSETTNKPKTVPGPANTPSAPTGTINPGTTKPPAQDDNSKNPLANYSYADNVRRANKRGTGFANFFHKAFMNTKIKIIPKSSGKSGGDASLTGDHQKDIWNYLTGNLKWTPQGTAGAMGNFQRESSCDPNRVEADFLDKDRAKKALESPAAMSEYTQNVVFAKTRGIDPDAYRGTDGYYYCGLGIAQWTGPRAQQVGGFSGGKLDDLGAQLKLLAKETSSGGNRASVGPKMQQATDVSQATSDFGYGFEGNVGGTLSERTKFAQEIYNKFSSGSSNDNNNNNNSDGNKYEQGTPWVPSDQIALLHEGEAVIPAAQNPFNSAGTTSVPINNTEGNELLAAILNEIKSGINRIVQAQSQSNQTRVMTPSDYGSASVANRSRTFNFVNKYQY